MIFRSQLSRDFRGHLGHCAGELYRRGIVQSARTGIVQPARING